MPDTARLRIIAAWTVFALMGIFARCARAQTNPYRMLDNWARLPPGRTLGFITGVDVDKHGHVWVLERCGADTCVGSNLDPILEFDASGKFLKSFGAGMFVFPHGFHLDKEGNVWTTDGNRDDGKGETVIEQLLYVLVFGEIVSIYLALLNGVDPSSLKLVSKFKEAMGGFTG